MNLSTYTTARARFFSSLESIGELSIIGQDIDEPITLKIKDIKGFVSYCSAVLIREPIVNELIDLRAPVAVTPDETLEFSVFLETTKLNDKLSYYFQATTFVNRESLKFRDRGLLGATNEYKPFDSSDGKTVDSMTTNTLDDIRSFSNKYFKANYYRGTVAFNRATKHLKGYTIYLSDKQMYLVIIGAKYNSKTNINNYTAVLYTGV